MYLKKDYCPVTCYRLLKYEEEIKVLDPGKGSFDCYKSRDMLLKLGIVSVRTGHRKEEVSLLGKRWLPRQVEVAMRYIVRKTSAYLEKYRERYEREKAEGKLDWMLGEQREFDFEVGIRCGRGMESEGLSRDDIRTFFMQQRQKSKSLAQ